MCQDQRTGTYFITTDDYLMAQISLERGEIVFLFYQNKHGADALPLLAQINAGRAQFAEGPISTFRTALPPTPDILSYLGINIKEHAAGAYMDAAMSGLSEHVKRVIKEVLAQFIGPMAAVVCDNLPATVRDLDSALDAVSRELPNPAQIPQFKAAVRKRL